MSAPIVGTVLVVDDSELVVDVVASGFSDEGWTVHTASTGTQGVALARTRPELEVVVCDLHLGDTTGYAVVEALAALRPELPVIMLSGDDDLSAVMSAVRRGAFDYVVKTDLGPLLASAERAVRHHRALRRERALLDEIDRVAVALAGIAQRAQESGDDELADELKSLAVRLERA